jgi:hypothetical protein
MTEGAKEQGALTVAHARIDGRQVRAMAVGNGRVNAGRAGLFSGLTLAFCLSASAGEARMAFASEPIYEHSVLVAEAFGLERLAARASALAAFDEPPEGLLEQAQKMRTRDMPLFFDRLQESAPDTAETLAAAVEAALAPDGAGEAAAKGESLLAAVEDAREVLFPEAVRETAEFQVALMAKLLLADDGVGESYEDAAEGDTWEYPTGWAALQRVHVLWEDLPRRGEAEAAAEVDLMLEYLDALLPEAEPPAQFVGDPEEPEAYSHRLVGFLEVIADADLYPGRDLPRMAAMVEEIAMQGCGSDIEGPHSGVQLVSVANFYYRETLRRPLSILAADAHEQAGEAFAGLRDWPDGEVEALCGQLLAALAEGRAAFGPVVPR